jgi:hypothetical protein
MILNTFNKILLVGSVFAVSALANEKVCAPYFELINLPDEFQLSTIRILQSKVDDEGTRTLVIPQENDSIHAGLPLSAQMDWAKNQGCQYLLNASLTRLGETVQTSAKIYPTGSDVRVYQQSFNANSPDDLVPVMGQISSAISSQDFSHSQSIYDVSRADAKSLTKKRSTMYYSGMVGYDAYTEDNQFMAYGFSALWDNRTFMGEVSLRIGVNANNSETVEASAYTSFNIHILKPHNNNDHSFYYGGGVGFMALSKVVMKEEPYDYGYTSGTYMREEEESYGGLNLSAVGGFMIGRASDFRARLQGEANLFLDQGSEKKVLPGAGLRVIIDIGT